MQISTDIIVRQESQIAEMEQFTNSLSGFTEQLQNAVQLEMLNAAPIPGTFGGGLNMYGSPGVILSQTDTLFHNLRWYMVSNLRQLLSQAYVEHGIIQTLVDQPVDDAFRAGFEIKTSQLSKDEVEKLKVYLERNQVVESIKQSIKWSRLYGGGALLIIVPQNPATPLRLSSITETTDLEIRSVDMWELYFSSQQVSGDLYPGGQLGANMGDFYNYYGRPIHKSRVFRIIGKQAPSFIRPRLRGWGMSELERLIRSLNQYLKNQDVIFELLDEAKVDVYRMKGYNEALLKKGGTASIANRVQTTNKAKNFNNAITMDKEDEYEQKQMSFSGLSEIILQIRQGIAADLKMPMTKLFGISAAGFSSGEDDIENYNSMLEGEIRAKNKFMVVDVVGICCQKLFGFIPDDLLIDFNPLRILNAKEEEEVKDSQFTRVTSAFSIGLATAQEAKQSFNKDSLLGVEVDENSEALPPLEVTPPAEPKGATGKAGKQTPQAA